VLHVARAGPAVVRAASAFLVERVVGLAFGRAESRLQRAAAAAVFVLGDHFAHDRHVPADGGGYTVRSYASRVRDVLSVVERWSADGRRLALATVVERQGSAPRDPGATLALADDGAIAGSVTGGCVEPSVIEVATRVLEGAPPELAVYGISDDEAFQVGLSCGGTVAIAVFEADTALLEPLAAAVRADSPAALLLGLDGAALGRQQLLTSDDDHAEPVAEAARTLLAAGESAIVDADGERVFVCSFAPRPALYVFGAIDHASALARVGRFLGYRVTVCDARARFVTPERFPEVDELVVEWPDRFLAEAQVDARTAICVLTHDPKFDIPTLRAALATPAAYIGAMGSRKTTADREQQLREEGVSDADLARIHAPIGLAIGARTPEEVAVAIGAELVASTSAASRSSVPLASVIA
jgi:xanthine dehydrogenase accessory factor